MCGFRVKTMGVSGQNHGSCDKASLLLRRIMEQRTTDNGWAVASVASPD